MTAIDAGFAASAFSAAPFASSRRTKLRMTRRGRRALVALIAAPLAAAIAWGTVAGGSALASREQGVEAGSFSMVTVAPGDSLWSIAVEVAPASDPRDVVDAIMRLNALDVSTVDVGDRLAIPAEYDR